MTSSLWRKIAMVSACIVWWNTAVLGEAPELVTEVAVQTSRITKTTLHRYVMAYGMVEPEPALDGKPPASSKIAAPVMGILTQIHCEEGQYVKKGTLLFELDTRSADALFAKAKVAVEYAQKNFVRKQRLRSTDNVSRKLYEEAKHLYQSARKDLLNAHAQRELLRIKAPLSGTVAIIHFKVGEAVSLNTILADVIDLHRLNIAIRVPSQEAGTLRLGVPVDMSTSSTHDWNGNDVPPIQQGTVTFIGFQVDPLTDTLLVRASLNTGPGLRPGQFVSVRILIEVRPDRLAVPIESVVTREGESVIAVVEGDRAKQKVIKPGLREGMTIVTQGVYGLPPKTRIRVVQ